VVKANGEGGRQTKAKGQQKYRGKFPGYEAMLRTGSTPVNSIWQSEAGSSIGYLFMFTRNESTVSSNFHEHVHNKLNSVNDAQEYDDDGHKITAIQIRIHKNEVGGIQVQKLT
jgi:hypothetical protein